MKRIMIFSLIALLLIAIYVVGSWNRNRHISIIQVVPSGFVYETGADGLPKWTKSCAGLVHYYGPDEGPLHHFAVGDNCCFISDNAPEANAVLEKCPIGTGCRFKAEIEGGPPFGTAARDRGRWEGCIVDHIIGPIGRTAIVKPTAIAQPYYRFDETR
jgi:hypothetical protein